MRHIKRFLAPGEDYLAYTSGVARLEAGLALLVFGLFFVWVALPGILSATLPQSTVSFGANIFLIAAMLGAPLFLIKVSGQPLGAVGLRSKGFGRSLLLSLLPIAILCGWRVLRAVLLGGHLPLSGAALGLFLIWQLTKNVGEELLFRGYIGSRLYGAMKHKWLAVLFSGALFALIHVPQRAVDHMVYFDMSLLEYLLSFNCWFAFFHTTAFSCVAHWLYAKHNNLAGPVLFHTLFNLSLQLTLT